MVPEDQSATGIAPTESGEPVFLPVGFVDLEATLDGGQAFRWWPEEDGAYRGVVGRRVVTV
ncbi:MAG: DNA glycosylase, partial [Chloroflexi bacterium]|nr:DNA glycosylase [Chloroflexota bacterium]